MEEIKLIIALNSHFNISFFFVFVFNSCAHNERIPGIVFCNKAAHPFYVGSAYQTPRSTVGVGNVIPPIASTLSAALDK